MQAKTVNIKIAQPNIFTIAAAVFVAVCQLFSPAFAHAPHDVVNSLAISPTFSTDNSIYGVVRGNLLKSTNRGATWKRLVNGLDIKSYIQLVAIDPRLPNFLYLAAASDGIYKSQDAGLTWHKANQGLMTFAIRALYVVPTSSHAVVFAADKQKTLYRTVDAGTTWTKVYDNSVAITAINGFGWDFLANRQVLIGDAAGTVSISNDGGSIWQKIFQRPDCGSITTLGILGKPLIKNRYFLGTSKCGIFRTVDGGLSFQQANTGIEDLNIRSIAMSPDFNNDATVFASTWSKAIFISADAGLTWNKFDKGITTNIQARAAGFPRHKSFRKL